jgi:sporulation protein YlmC with PRC-barrel domain
MRVDLEARVMSRDGAHVGHVARAVIDPGRNEIRHFVINTGGLLGRDLLLPSAEIGRARVDGDAVRLKLTKEEVDALPSYLPDDYVVPPLGWGYAGMYGLAWSPGAYAWPASYPYPAGVGTAPDAASASGRARDADPTIGKGAVVYDRDGDDLGVVDDVLLDPASGRLRGFVLRVGGAFRTLFGGGAEVEITPAAVERVVEGSVHLRVAKEQVERVASSR